MTRRARRAGVDSPWLPLSLVLVFAGSRIVYWYAGVRFSTDQLGIAIQYLDPELLRTHLVESIWYLHIQPPLYNLGLGLVLKAAPGHAAIAFHVVYLALGLTEILCLFALVKELGAPRWLAWGVAVLVSASPASILYENRLFYDYVVLVLLTGASLLALRLEARPTTGRCLALFGVLAALVLTRSVYQIVFLVAVLAIVLGLRVVPRRAAVLAALPALLVVSGLMLKNEIVFGSPATSSFIGENLERVAVTPAPLYLRRRLVASGELDPLVLVPNFSPVSAYRPYVGSPRPTGVAALDRVWKSDGKPNFNNATYLDVQRRLLRTSVAFAFHHPQWYARGIKLATERYFWPPTYPAAIVGVNKYAIGHVEALSEAGFYGSTPRLNRVGLLSVLLFLIALGFGGVVTFRPGDPHRFTIAFVWFVLLYTTVVGVAGDLGENYRTRLPADPLALALAALGAHRAWQWYRRRRAKPIISPPSSGGFPGEIAHPSE